MFTFLRTGVAVILLAVIFLASGCKSKKNVSRIYAPKYRLYIYGDYANPKLGEANNPQWNIDLTKTDKEVIIPSAQSVSTEVKERRINLTVNNVRFQDSVTVYKVKSVVSEELREGRWVEDSENPLYIRNTGRLDFIMVLDVSSSLGQDVKMVKRYALEFIKRIKEQRDSMKVVTNICVIGFSDKIDTLRFTSDMKKVTKFVNNLEGSNATRLYQAIDLGVDLLDSTKADGKALVTFTDGRNNAWDDAAKHSEFGYVANRLAKPTKSGTTITSFNVGLAGKGGVDPFALKNLSKNGGTFRVAYVPADLEAVFSDWSAQVASVFNVTLNRNTSPIPNKLPIRFAVRVEPLNKNAYRRNASALKNQ